MENNINRQQVNGGIEKFGMTSLVEGELSRIFEDRGRDMATLLVATLTESSYSPEIDGLVYAVKVSSKIHEDDLDTVLEAREALAEALAVTVDGERNDRMLVTLSTEYPMLVSGVGVPNRRDGKRNSDKFEEAFVDTARRSGVLIPDPKTGYKIIRKAPREIVGLSLTGNVPKYEDGRAVKNDLLTLDGVIVKYNSWLPEAHILSNVLSHNLQFRGGDAPSSSVVDDIKRRLVEIKTDRRR